MNASQDDRTSLGLDLEEMRQVAKRLRPDLTDAQFAAMWADHFRAMRRAPRRSSQEVH